MYYVAVTGKTEPTSEWVDHLYRKLEKIHIFKNPVQSRDRSKHTRHESTMALPLPSA